MANPLSNYQQRQAIRAQRDAQQNANQVAGLELRERALEEQAAKNAASQQINERAQQLNELQFQREQAVKQYDMALKAEAAKQAIAYGAAVARLSEQDPDFESHVAALQSNFPYATFSPEGERLTKMKSEAHQRVRDANAKITSETGIDPWSADYVVRDQTTGRFLRVDWGKHGSAVGERRKGIVAGHLANAPMGGTVTTKLPDGTTISTPQPSALGIVADANVPVPDAANAAAGTPAQAVAAVQAGIANVQAGKDAAANARNVAATRATQLRALLGKAALSGPDKAAAEAFLADLEKEATAPPVQAAPTTKQGLLEKLKGDLKQ